jgi:hypothetical protein
VWRDADVDLTMPMPKLVVQAAIVRGGPHEAETVQHVPQQGEKARTVQPVTTEPPINTKGGVGVVIHLSKQRRNGSTFYPSNRDNNKTQHKPQRQHFNSVFKNWIESVLNEQSLLNWLLTSNDTDLGEEHYTKVVDNFDTFPVSSNTSLYDKQFTSNDL